MEDSSLNWDSFEYCPPECMEYEEEVEKGSSGFGWVLSKGLSWGKKLAVTGVVVSSAPIVVPPLLVVSALGIASSVPFGFMYASYTCTEKLMSKLLPLPETVGYDEEEEDLVGYKERLGDGNDGVFDKRRYYREELANEYGEVVVAGEYPVEDLGEDGEISISQKYTNEVAAGVIVTGGEVFMPYHEEDKVQLDDDAGGCSEKLICDDDEVMQLTEDYCNELRAVEELTEDVEESWKDDMNRGDSVGVTEGDESVVPGVASAARDVSTEEVISDENVNVDMLLDEGSISADHIVVEFLTSPAGRQDASGSEGSVVPVEIAEDFVVRGPSTTDGVVEVIMAEAPVSADGTPEAIGVECPIISDRILEELMVEGPTVSSGVVVEIMDQGPFTPTGRPEASGIEGQVVPVEIVEDFVVEGPSNTAGVVEVIMAEGPIADKTLEGIEVQGPIISDDIAEEFVVEAPTTTSGVVVEIMDKGPITPAEILEQSVVESPITTSGFMEEIMVEGPISSDGIPITPVVMVEEVGVGTITPAGSPEALGVEGPISAARTPEAISMEGLITPAGTVEELPVKGPTVPARTVGKHEGPTVPARTVGKLKGPSVPVGTVLSPALDGGIHDRSKIKTAPTGLEDKTGTRLGGGSELQTEVTDTSSQKEMGKSDLKDKPHTNFGRKDETNVLGSKEAGKSKKGQTKGKGKKRTPKTPEAPITTAGTRDALRVEGPITPVGTPEAPGVKGPISSAGTPEEIRVEGSINPVVTSKAIGAGGPITPDVMVEELAVKVPTVPARTIGEQISPIVPVGTVLVPELHGGINDSRNKNKITHTGLEDKTAVKLDRGSELHSNATETSSHQKEVVQSDLIDKPDTNLGGYEKHVHGSADESKKRHTNVKGKNKTSKTQKRVQGDISKAQEKDRMEPENASGKVSGEALGSAPRESKVIWDGDAIVEGPEERPQVVGQLKITEVKPADKNLPCPSVKDGSISRSDGDIKNIPEVGSILDGEIRVQGDVSKAQEKDRMKHENVSGKVSGEAFGSTSCESQVIWDSDTVVEGPDLSPQVVGQLKITEVKPVDKNQPGPSVKDRNKRRSDGDIKNIPEVGSIFYGEIKEKNKNAGQVARETVNNSILEVSAPAPVHVLKQHNQSSESKGNSSVHEADSRHHHQKDVPRDDDIWKQIDSIRLIVGFKLPRHSSYFEELKALYLFTGIEPPSMFSDPSDMPEFCHKLRFLMSVIGVK